MNSVNKSVIFIILSVFLFSFCCMNTFGATEMPAVAISGGELHTLVLGENGQVFSCGSNYFDQLGLGDSPPQDTTILRRVHGQNDIGFLVGIDDISAGWVHSLALDANTTVWSWGDDGYGQLGNGPNDDDSSVPVHVLSGEQDPDNDESLLEDIIEISAGRSGEHSLAVDVNHICYAWGRDNEGQLGNGNDLGTSQVPVEVNDTNNIGRLENIIAVSAGEQHSMALDSDGFVWTFGDDSYGKLGNGLPYDNNQTPVKVHGVNDVNYLEGIVAISAGWDHSMALKGFDSSDPNSSGRVYCWGNNGIGNYGDSGGRLGNGQVTGSNSLPVIVLAGQQDPNHPRSSYLKNIVAISAGDSHSMALDIYGNVWTWGDNYCDQLGTGDDNDANVPVKVVAPDRNGDNQPDDLDGDPNTIDYLGDDFPIVKISAGYWHCLAIDQQGRIYSWGRGDSGSLGLGDTEDYNLPKPIDKLYYPPVHNITQSIDYYKIQTAINDADSNDIIVADPQTYEENVDFDSKKLTLRSTDPNDWSVVADTIIDGGGSDNTVYLENNIGSTLSGFTITNGLHGIRGDASNVTVYRCIVEMNNSVGIYITNHSSTITNNIIRNNGTHGICINKSSQSLQSVIKNNLIHNNNNGSGTYSGISLHSMNSQAIVRNNTVVYNPNWGIYVDGTAADIKNSIIRYNGYSLGGSYSVTYSCVDKAGEGNISYNPQFGYNFHLSPDDIPCIDSGTGTYTDETDIDGEDRTVNGVTDMGSDEFYRSPGDFDDSNMVNFIDYAMFATAWATELGDQDYNDIYDLEDNNSIDYNDLSIFCDNWLWIAAWAESEQMMMSMGGGGDNFISMGSLSSDSAKLEIPQPIYVSAHHKPASVSELLDWVDELWESGDIKEYMTYEQYIEFRDSIKESTPLY